jgi:hypothetical protein
MNKTKKAKNNSYRKNIIDNPIAVLIMAFLAIPLGIFFIVSQAANKPIPREEALSYSGEFEKYETSKNYCEIYFKDGSYYYVYPHTESYEFRNMMKSLEPGTKLYILVNPNNDYVVEVRTETEELLNFKISQQEIDSYDNGYIAIGIFACVAGVFLIIYVIGSTKYKRKENERDTLRKLQNPDKTDSAVIRFSDAIQKNKILLKTNVAGYEICYRRVRFVNELVVNGRVYDEKKGILEFEHKLCAIVDGHDIEAGYDSDSCSYIKFDRTIVKRKKRLI